MRQLTLGRNVSAEMRQRIEEEIAAAGPVWIPAAMAVTLVERLAEEDPALLGKWLEENAVHMVQQAIITHERAKRSNARIQADRGRQSVFTKALAQYEEEGDSRVLTAWLDTTYVVSTANERKRLADMDRSDLDFAAGRYTRLARSNAMQAAFLRVLAEKVGARTVREVLSEEDLTRAWRELDL